MYRKANLIISVLTAMSWLAAVSLSGTDRLIVGTFLFPILPLIPFVGHLWIPVVKNIQKKGENREPRIQAFVVPVSISGEPGISHTFSCRNMPDRIYPCHLQRNVSVIQRPILSAQRTF